MTSAQLDEIDRALRDAPAYNIDTPEGKLVLAAFRYVHFAQDIIIDSDQHQFILDAIAEAEKAHD